jgi:hypothetical protein
MIAFAVYVISMDARQLVAEKFQSANSIPDETIFSGLLTALQGIASEITQSNTELHSITIDNLTYHFKSFGQFQIVLVTDFPKSPDNILRKLGIRFMKEHGEELMDQPADLKIFKPFTKTINEVIKAEMNTDDTRKINPLKKFNNRELYQLPENLQSTALALITLKEATVDEISQESGVNSKNTALFLKKLQDRGLIGEKVNKDSKVFFCTF